MAKAVATGYFSYKDCTLEGGALKTAELWAVSAVQDDDIKYLRKTRLDIYTSMLALGGESTKDRVEAIQGLWLEIYNDIMQTSHHQEQETSDSRYEEVFGIVTDEDIEQLTNHLENRALMTDQETMSKEQALKLLENELSNRFRSRIG